jgi:hypothetical protein
MLAVSELLLSWTEVSVDGSLSLWKGYLSNSVCLYNKLNLAKRPVNYMCPFEDIYALFWFVWLKTDNFIPSNKWDEQNNTHCPTSLETLAGRK